MSAPNVKLARKVSGSFQLFNVGTTWSMVEDKPSTFTPASHSHSANDITSDTLHVDRIPSLPYLPTSGGTLTGDLISNESILMPFRGTAGTDRVYTELSGVSANDSTNEGSGAFTRFRTSTADGYGADIGAHRRGGGNSAFIVKTGGQNPTESIRVDENKNLIVQGDVTANGQDLIKDDDSRLSDSRPASDVYSWAKASSKPSYNATEINTDNDNVFVTLTQRGNIDTAFNERGSQIAGTNLSWSDGNLNVTGVSLTGHGHTASDVSDLASIATSGSASHLSTGWVPLARGRRANSTGTGVPQYNAHTRSPGRFYGGSTAPAEQTSDYRMNYDGIFRASQLHEGSDRVATKSYVDDISFSESDGTLYINDTR